MKKTNKIFLLRCILTISLLVLGNLLRLEGIVSLIFFLFVYLIIGYDIIIKSIKNLAYGGLFSEEFLMTVASIGAIVLGFLKTGDYNEAVAVMFFFQVGENFQRSALSKSRANIRELVDITEDSANIERDNSLVKVDARTVNVGDVIIVKPGERIPIDGIIVEGESSIDTSALTGESLLKEALVDDVVLSGCLNITGVIKVKTTHKFENSKASKILELILNASARKAKTEEFITKFAKVYTPLVLSLALVLAFAVPLALSLLQRDVNFLDWLYRALTFLVISCPCALVISVPLSFFSTLGVLSKSGILVKGTTFIERMSKIHAVVFDKTGTLTKGSFKIDKIFDTQQKEEELLFLVYQLEKNSNHPLAKALCNSYIPRQNADISNVIEYPGRGISGTVDNRNILAGTMRFLKENGVNLDEEGDNNIAIYIADDGEYRGCIRFRDEIKPGARRTIEFLKSNKVKRTVMLTGDNESALQVANELSIDECYTRLLPDEKIEHLERIIQESGENNVIFVGDGINDAPSLKRADVGIAMADMGSDLAIEASDIIFIDDDINKLRRLVKTSSICMSIVKWNIGFCIAVKVVCLILGSLGLASLSLAIFADVGVMVIAVLNSIRPLLMLKYKKEDL